MTEEKEHWIRPQLIVLGRGTPEESVLTHCKTMNPNAPVEGAHDIYQHDTCAGGEEFANCRNCQSRAFGS